MGISRRGFCGAVWAGLLGLFGVGRAEEVAGGKPAVCSVTPIPEGVLSVDAGWTPEWVDEDGRTAMERWAVLRLTEQCAFDLPLASGSPAFFAGTPANATDAVLAYLAVLGRCGRDLSGHGLIWARYRYDVYGRELTCSWRYARHLRRV